MSSSEPLFHCQSKEGSVPFPVMVVLSIVLMPLFYHLAGQDLLVAFVLAAGIMAVGHFAPMTMQEKVISIYERDIRVVTQPPGMGEPVRSWPLSGVRRETFESRSFMGFHFIRFRTARGEKVTLYFPDRDTKARAAALVARLLDAPVGEGGSS